MGRGQHCSAETQRLLYGQRRVPSSPRRPSYPPATDQEQAKQRLLRLGFEFLFGQESEHLQLPEELQPGMVYRHSILYSANCRHELTDDRPRQGELRLLIYPEWNVSPPMLMTEPMRHFYRELTRLGLGHLRLEFTVDGRGLDCLESLAGAEHMQLTAPEGTDDNRNEAELLVDLCEESGISRQGAANFSELLIRDRVAAQQLCDEHGELMVAVPAAVLAQA